MRQFAIRLLTLAMYATALATVSFATPAEAAADGGKATKRHTKRSQGSHVEAPRSYPEVPRNMSDDPARKVGGY
ncbi:MAG TPA: hypothetical protein VKS24_17820 [Bradyrhizobium sp.]|nr:hypothetical protein [Bradyrhizobium sp.]